MKKPQIIAMGGGGFSMEPDNPLLDEYFLAQTGKQKSKICFLPTASGDVESYIARFYVIATYGSLNGTFASVLNEPTNYHL